MDIQVEDTERGYGYIVFPAPLEVDRYLYPAGGGRSQMALIRFRPLAR